MAENYKLVSEDEWQAMVDRAEVAEGWSEHWKSGVAELKERAEKAERQNGLLRIAKNAAEHRADAQTRRADDLGRDLAALLDQKADREEPVEWVERGKTETVSRYDTDGRLIYHGPLEDAPAFGESETDTRDNAERFEYVTENGVRTPIERPRKVKWYEQDEPRPLPPYMGPEPCDCEHLAEVREAGPQRPHESLIWAMFIAAQMPGAQENPVRTSAAKTIADALLEVWRERWPEESK